MKKWPTAKPPSRMKLFRRLEERDENPCLAWCNSNVRLASVSLLERTHLPLVAIPNALTSHLPFITTAFILCPMFHWHLKFDFISNYSVHKEKGKKQQSRIIDFRGLARFVRLIWHSMWQTMECNMWKVNERITSRRVALDVKWAWNSRVIQNIASLWVPLEALNFCSDCLQLWTLYYYFAIRKLPPQYVRRTEVNFIRKSDQVLTFV